MEAVDFDDFELVEEFSKMNVMESPPKQVLSVLEFLNQEMEKKGGRKKET